jgi:hypothetical protein
VALAVIATVNASNVAAALDVVDEKANNPEQLKLHPQTSQVILQ